MSSNDRYLGVCYYPEHWPSETWVADANRMAQLGLTYVRIGEFAWSRMEPFEGQYDWAWLDEAIETLGDAGLKVVLCTPTPTPPRWLSAKEPGILRHDEHGIPMKHGTRRHVSVASAVYRPYSQRITKALAARYGNNPHVAGWQTDNEFGCHHSTLSYGPEDRAAFSRWLEARYNTVAALNEAWGTVFWSQEYSAFSDVELPNQMQAQLNPAHWLAFRRFFSDMTAEFNREQCDIIRTHSPDRWITHNFMVNETSFDHWKLGSDLDLASWDSYPLGFLEFFGTGFGVADESVIERYMRIGHPDIVAFQHDLYRGVGRGRFWVMEQQPGPVNWSTYNPAPIDGAVRFWSLEAFAHGAETVSYFRWRQAPWSQEQYHTGLNRWDGTEDRAFTEAAQVHADLKEMPSVTAENIDWDRTAALVFDYNAVWQLEAAEQGADQALNLRAFTWYHALRRAGLNVEIVPNAAATKARLVINPFTAHFEHSAFESQIVLNASRSGTRSEEASMDNTGIARVLRAESVRSTHRIGVDIGGVEVQSKSWVEHLEADDSLEVLARFRPSQLQSGLQAAWVARGSEHYLAFDPDERAIAGILTELSQRAGLVLTPMSDDIRVRWTSDHVFVLNFGPDAFDPASGGLTDNDIKNQSVGPYQVGWFKRA